MKMDVDIGIPLVGQRKISAVLIPSEPETLPAFNSWIAQEFFSLDVPLAIVQLLRLIDQLLQFA
jgi:hypothetical protein